MILLWISIPDLHFIHRRHPPNYVWICSILRKLLCPHKKSTYVHTARQTDGNFFWLVLSSKSYKSWTFVKRRDFFFHSCDYNTFFFYILRMWWESKKLARQVFVKIYFWQRIFGKMGFWGHLTLSRAHFIFARNKIYQWSIGFRGRWLRFCIQNRKIQNGGFNVAAILTKLMSCSNWTEMNIKKFVRSLITILTSKMENSWWRI